MNNILIIKNLSISFKKNKRVVNKVNINIPKGKTVAIVGESGSGKTLSALSILKLLPSSAKIDEGEIFYKKNNLLNLPTNEIEKIRGNKISTIFQEPMSSLNPLHTIQKQIQEIITTHNQVNKVELDKKTTRLLSEVNLNELSNRQKIYSYELSGGQRQRVMIAMSIANNPDILIADEPTTALDVTVQLQILELLKNIQKNRNMSILFISHDLGVVRKIADFVYVMKDGKIIENGNTNEIFKSPKETYTKELVGFESQKRINTIKAEKEILNVQNLKVWYPIKKGLLKKTVNYVKAIDDVSFDLKEKETIGIVGESGSGKTSLVLAILKLIKSTGNIMVNDVNINKIKKNELLNLRKDIQIVFQDPYSSLSPRMNVSEIISEGLHIHYYKFSENEKKQMIVEILKDIGMDYDRDHDKYPHEFSGGQRQRIAIARALIKNAPILVMDEATSSLDNLTEREIQKVLDELMKDKTTIIIAHRLSTIKDADIIFTIDNGKIENKGNHEHLIEHSAVYKKLQLQENSNEN